jgi:hypothetical protein
MFITGMYRTVGLTRRNNDRDLNDVGFAQRKVEPIRKESPALPWDNAEIQISLFST